MNQKDKDQLIILGFLVVSVGLSLLFIFGTSKLPIWAIVALIALVKFLWMQPAITRMYFEVHEMKAPITRFFPLYNEIMILASEKAIPLLVTYVILAIFVALLFMPVSVIGAILGESFALNYGVYVIRVIFVAVVCNVICYAIAFCDLMRNIESMYLRFINSGNTRVFKIYDKLFLFLPIVRVVTLLDIYNKLYTLTKLNAYTVTQTGSDELKEEN